MAKSFGIYKCNICGNTVEMIEAYEPNVVCCGQEMKLMEEKIEEEGQEKHVPVVETNGQNITVKVGEVPHPMQDAHFIELIELLKDGKVIAGKWLTPTNEPKATFCLEDVQGVSARIYCNVHGAWKN
ncbi:MAG: desulfoferrodoxin [Nanoarchaeota archaeon]